jgi:hypothetical protein
MPVADRHIGELTLEVVPGEARSVRFVGLDTEAPGVTWTAKAGRSLTIDGTAVADSGDVVVTFGADDTALMVGQPWRLYADGLEAAGEYVVPARPQSEPGTASVPILLVDESTVTVTVVTAAPGTGGGADLSDDDPVALGTAGAGAATEAARSDHVHPLPSAVDVGADAAGSADAAEAAAIAAAATDATTKANAAEAAAISAAATDATTKATAATTTAIQRANHTGTQAVTTIAGARGWDGMSVAALGLTRFGASTRTMMHWIFWGDSVTQAEGVESKTTSWVEHLRRRIARDWGITVHDGFQPIDWGNGASAFRWTISTGWSSVGLTASNHGPHGITTSARRATTGAIRTLTWTRPSHVSVDRVTVWWVDDTTATAGGVWSYSTNGGASWTAVAPTRPGTPTLTETTITGLSNPTDFRIRNATADGASNYVSPVFLGISVASAATGLTIHNMGVSGSLLQSANGSVAGTRDGAGGDWGAMFDALAPELVCIEFSNDSSTANYNQANFDTAIAEVVTRLSPYADLIALGFQEQADFNRPKVNQDAIRTSYQNAVLGAKGAVLDLKARWGDQTASAAAGMIAGTGFPVHPLAAGDLEVGAALSRLIRAYA